MTVNVYGHVHYQHKTASELLSINIDKLSDFVKVQTLGLWFTSGGEIVYLDTPDNAAIGAKNISLSLINLMSALKDKSVFCDGSIAIVDGDKVIYVQINKDDIRANYGELSEFPISI